MASPMHRLLVSDLDHTMASRILTHSVLDCHCSRLCSQLIFLNGCHRCRTRMPATRDSWRLTEPGRSRRAGANVHSASPLAALPTCSTSCGLMHLCSHQVRRRLIFGPMHVDTAHDQIVPAPAPAPADVLICSVGTEIFYRIGVCASLDFHYGPHSQCISASSEPTHDSCWTSCELHMPL